MMLLLKKICPLDVKIFHVAHLKIFNNINCSIVKKKSKERYASVQWPNMVLIMTDNFICLYLMSQKCNEYICSALNQLDLLWIIFYVACLNAFKWKCSGKLWENINGFVQDCGNSNGNAQDLPLSCAKLSIYILKITFCKSMSLFHGTDELTHWALGDAYIFPSELVH